MKIPFSALLIWFSILYAHSQFQPTQVVRSNQIIRYQGANYYIHTVQQGQTLYRICHTYAVSEAEIAESNPGVSLSPLSVGQVLKIPVVKASGEEKPDMPGEEDFIYHTVRPQETVYFLHKKYNVPVEMIHRYNPGSEQGIQIGQVIRLPKGQKESATVSSLYRPQTDQEVGMDTDPQQPGQQTEYKTYRVQAGDSLYRISETYGISINDLIFVNPELRWGLKVDQLLKIPPEPLTISDYLYDLQDTVFAVLDFERLSKYQCDSIRSLKRMPPPIKAVLMLPFFTQEVLRPVPVPGDSAMNEDLLARRNLMKGRIAAEFYEGILLSLDSLKMTGLDISLFVYDTEDDTNRVAEILKDLEVVEPDLIIGPLSPDNIRTVSRFAFERKIPFLPPLATQDDIFRDNPYIFKTIPSAELERETYTNYLVRESEKRNVVLIYKKNLKYQSVIDSFKTGYLSRLAEKRLLDSLFFSEVLINDSLVINLDSALHDQKENLVFVFSSYEPDVISTLAQLHFLMRDHKIIVYGLPSWQTFENVRIDVIHELQVSLHSPFYINYGDEEVLKFLAKCREKLAYEPYKTSRKGTGINYTFLGYDIGMYFFQNLRKYNDNLCGCIEYADSDQLLSEFRFRRNLLTGSLENSGFNYIRYDKDYVVRTRELRAE